MPFFVLSGNKERKENLVSVKHERSYDALEMNSHSEIAHKKKSFHQPLFSAAFDIRILKRAYLVCLQWNKGTSSAVNIACIPALPPFTTVEYDGRVYTDR